MKLNKEKYEWAYEYLQEKVYFLNGHFQKDLNNFEETVFSDSDLINTASILTGVHKFLQESEMKLVVKTGDKKESKTRIELARLYYKSVMHHLEILKKIST